MTKKKPKRKGRSKGKGAARAIPVNYQVVVGVTAVVLAALWLLYPTYQVRVRQQKQLESVQRQYARLRGENRSLKTRIKQIKSPEYVERYAREKLGLVKPGENAYVVLPPSESKPASKTPVRAVEPTESAETTGTWDGVKAFFARLFGR